MSKHIFVTGGVVSSLGKGITAASLGRLLKARGYKVMMQKADPYLNVDPGLTLTLVIMSALLTRILPGSLTSPLASFISL